MFLKLSDTLVIRVIHKKAHFRRIYDKKDNQFTFYLQIKEYGLIQII